MSTAATTTSAAPSAKTAASTPRTVTIWPPAWTWRAAHDPSREGGQDYPYTLIADSIHNIYNMVTVIAVLRQLAGPTPTSSSACPG